jgi:hypothetical protein
MVTTDPPPADVASDAPPCVDTGAPDSRRIPSHLHSPFGTDRFGKAYAAPLILLAQTRQADRDKGAADELARIAAAQRRHVEEQSAGLRELLQTNTALTRRIAALTSEIHAAACGPPSPQLGDDDPSPPPEAVPQPGHETSLTPPPPMGFGHGSLSSAMPWRCGSATATRVSGRALLVEPTELMEPAERSTPSHPNHGQGCSTPTTPRPAVDRDDKS